MTTETDVTPEDRANINNLFHRAAKPYSSYPPADGPRRQGEYYCPLTYSIPAMGSMLQNFASWRVDLPLRRRVKSVIRSLETEIRRIEAYAEWIETNRRADTDFYQRALETSRRFLSDLRTSRDLLNEAAKMCPTQSRKPAWMR